MVISSQQQADTLLAFWQIQGRLGIPADKRLLPENDNQSIEDFERDLQIIRACMERK